LASKLGRGAGQTDAIDRDQFLSRVGNAILIRRYHKKRIAKMLNPYFSVIDAFSPVHSSHRKPQIE
jgi:hypothetical protein